MDGYGDVAVKAANLIHQGLARSPKDAWNTAVAERFPDSKSSQEKSCPRSTFLGLCENGQVRGVTPGVYTRSKKNKEYAVRAIRELKHDRSLADDPARLWNAVLAGAVKAPNHQMAVVIALWRNDLVSL